MIRGEKIMLGVSIAFAVAMSVACFATAVAKSKPEHFTPPPAPKVCYYVVVQETISDPNTGQARQTSTQGAVFAFDHQIDVKGNELEWLRKQFTTNENCVILSISRL